MSINRNQQCEQIFINFKFLSSKHKLKLAKFIYSYDPKLIVEYSNGLRAAMPDMSDDLIAHVYNYIQRNVWHRI